MMRVTSQLTKNASRLLVFLLITLGPAKAYTKSPETILPTETQLDAIVDVPGDHPGVAIAVIRQGKVAITKTYGLADLASKTPFTVETRSNIGSTSKQFTAFAILLLVSENKLSLDDDVRRFIPELPDFGQKITLRHLLTHTSGYREMFLMRQLAGHTLEEPFDRSEVLRIVQRQPGLQTSPGREWDYNNTGYALLALIVERITATPFPTWMQQHVFMPLGMENTLVRVTPDDKVPHSARGYLRDANGHREARDLGAAQGAGAIYTTTADLALWMGNFKSGSVGGTGLFTQMATPAVATGFGNTAYGLGLYIDSWHGLRRIYHNGDDVAHHSAFYYFPDHETGILVQTNDASFNAVRAATQIAECVFSPLLNSTEIPKNLPPSDFDSSLFDRYTGSYESEKTSGLIYTFSRDQKRFWVTVGSEKMELTFLQDARFRVKGQNVDLEFLSAEKATNDSVIIFNRSEEKARRLTSPSSVITSSPRDLTLYAGEYKSAEVDIVYSFALDGDSLALLHPKFSQPIKLKLITGERFSGNDPVSSVVFERDSQNRITGFRIGKGAGYEYVRFIKSP